MVNQNLVEMPQFDRAQLELIRNTVAKGTTPEQFKLFIEVCRYHRLNPFARQIYAVVRGNQMVVQTSIDGYRLLAERSGKYAGQIGPQWCGEDGKWEDVWLSDKPPVAARVGVLRKDFQQPTWGVAKYKSYVQETSPLWRKMADTMLAKCAESLALRKAFPAEMSGIYTSEEMQQADSHDLPTVAPMHATTVEADPPAPAAPAPAEQRPPAQGQQQQTKQRQFTPISAKVTDGQQQQAAPAQTEATDAPASPQQLASIRKLCQHTNTSEPANFDKLTYTEAGKLIKELTDKYKAQRQQPANNQQQASGRPDAPIQEKATAAMINKAKSRVEALPDMIWGDVKRDALGKQVEDKDVTVAQYARIVAIIEQYEAKVSKKAS